MIHLYCGDGKGKTTAAMGLALRMAGRGKPVVIAQFLKGADSGERYALSLLPKVTLLPAPEQIKFSFQLTPEERAAEQKRYLRLIAQARTAAREIPDGLLGGALLPGGGGLRGGPHRPGPGPGAAGAGRLCDRDEKAPPPIRPGDGRPPGGGVVVPPFGGCPSCRKK